MESVSFNTIITTQSGFFCYFASGIFEKLECEGLCVFGNKIELKVFECFQLEFLCQGLSLLLLFYFFVLFMSSYKLVVLPQQRSFLPTCVMFAVFSFSR